MWYGFCFFGLELGSSFSLIGGGLAAFDVFLSFKEMRYFCHHRCHMARPQDSELVLRGALIYRWIYCRLAETSLWSRSGFGISWNIELATFFECLYFQLAKLNFSSHFASFKAWISSPEEVEVWFPVSPLRFQRIVIISCFQVVIWLKVAKAT